LSARGLRIAPIAAAAVVALAVTHTIDLWLLDRDVRWLEAGSGRSIFELTATATLGLCAVSAGVLAVVRPEGRRILVPVAVGLVVVFLIDGLALTDTLGAVGDALLVLLLGVVFALLWRYGDALVGDGTAIRVGLVLLAISVAIRAADPVFSELDLEPGHLPYETKVVIKHAAELAGWIFIASALIPAALSRRSRVPGPREAAGAAGSG
jgi:hypothetical protein